MRMNDLNLDNLLATNPYKVPHYLLELISTELRDNNIEFSSKPPQKLISSPVIVPIVYRRIPGTSKGIGRSFSGYHKSTTEGEIYEQYQQNYTVQIDFELYYPQSMDIEASAWQIEQAIVAQRGVLQTRFPGSDLIWKESYITRNPIKEISEIEKITIKFNVELPVYTVIPRKTINIIDFDVALNGLYYKDVRFERSSSEETYSISVTDRIVNNIHEIKLFRNNEYVTLVENLDYVLEQEIENSPTSPKTIRWITNTGLYPNVDEEFWVTFVASSLLRNTI